MENLVDSDVINEIVERYANEAVRVFKQEVKNAGLVATGDMLESIRFSAIKKGKDYITARIEYSEIYRIRDIKMLRYTTIPPVEVFEEWVRRTKNPVYFNRIPGYKDDSPTVKKFKAGILPRNDREAILNRIASAITFSYRRMPNVKRGYRGIYNEPLSRFVLPRFWNEVNKNAGMHALLQFRKIFNN